MDIYLDHASTTPVDDAVLEHIQVLLSEDYGNPSSLHRKGLAAERHLKIARKQVANVLNVDEKTLVFTSGGTEANTLAIKGVLPRHKKGRLICSAIEHPSVLKNMEALVEEGYELIKIPVDSKGVIKLDALQQALSYETQLVSMMHVNNEVGSIQPLHEIAAMIKTFNDETNARVLFHVDAIQSFGKLDINPRDIGIDLLSISGHKINGLKGTGALYVKEGIKLTPLFYGGQQEFGKRPGTENIVGIVALGKAAELAQKYQACHYKHVKALKDEMVCTLSKVPYVHFNGTEGSPYILNVSFLGTKGEILLHSLEMEGIYVSTGAACSSKKKNQSHVLEAMGASDEVMDTAIRLSFGSSLESADVEKATAALMKISDELRMIIKKR